MPNIEETIEWRNDSGETKKVTRFDGNTTIVLPGKTVLSHHNLQRNGFVQLSVPGIFLSVNSNPGADKASQLKVLEGNFNFSIDGTFVATVHIQRSFDGGTTWFDYAEITEVTERVFFEPQVGGILYRLVCKNNNYTSGSFFARLGY